MWWLSLNQHLCQPGTSTGTVLVELKGPLSDQSNTIICKWSFRSDECDSGKMHVSTCVELHHTWLVYIQQLECDWCDVPIRPNIAWHSLLWNCLSVCLVSAYTGNPKGVMLTHGNVVADFSGFLKVTDVSWGLFHGHHPPLKSRHSEWFHADVCDSPVPAGSGFPSFSSFILISSLPLSHPAESDFPQPRWLPHFLPAAGSHVWETHRGKWGILTKGMNFMYQDVRIAVWAERVCVNRTWSWEWALIWDCLMCGYEEDESLVLPFASLSSYSVSLSRVETECQALF